MIGPSGLCLLLLAALPPPPDYAQPRSWGARPEARGAADVNPPGVVPVDPTKAPADVFFIHPTSYFGADLNAGIDDATINTRTDSGSLANQASVFNGCCRIFAPRYRQASLSTFVWRSADAAQKAWGLAYDDVKRAFAYYLEHDNQGRPFLIASHSQGSRYALWLLQDMVEKTPAREHFVAAYIVGYGIPADWFTRNLSTIAPCKTATDVGCVLNWSTFGVGGDAKRLHQSESNRYGTAYESNAGKPLICTNPLSWTAGTAKADKALNLGLWSVRGGKDSSPKPGLTGAQCDDGALFIDGAGSADFPYPSLPGHNYHMVDYQVFYMNVRQNAAARVQAFVDAHGKPKVPAAH
jgi:hypothetical protein